MNDFSHTCGVGGGRPAWAGSSSKDRRLLLKREYHSNVFDRLRQDSLKAACSISYVQHQFSPDGNRNQCTHTAALSPLS